MTDSGDMMEVEAPAKPVAPPLHGPLSIAQLTSPWVEKYRPESLGDVIAHHDIVATLNRFVDQVQFSPAAKRVFADGMHCWCRLLGQTSGRARIRTKDPARAKV